MVLYEREVLWLDSERKFAVVRSEFAKVTYVLGGLLPDRWLATSLSHMNANGMT